MVPSQDARTAAASIALHAATAATHAGCIAVYIADWRRFREQTQATRHWPFPNQGQRDNTEHDKLPLGMAMANRVRLRMRMDSQLAES